MKCPACFQDQHEFFTLLELQPLPDLDSKSQLDSAVIAQFKAPTLALVKVIIWSRQLL